MGRLDNVDMRIVFGFYIQFCVEEFKNYMLSCCCLNWIFEVWFVPNDPFFFYWISEMLL